MVLQEKSRGLILWGSWILIPIWASTDDISFGPNAHVNEWLLKSQKNTPSVTFTPTDSSFYGWPTPELVERHLQAEVAHAAGVDVALLRSDRQVGRDAEAEIAVGVVLSLADLTLVYQLPNCPFLVQVISTTGGWKSLTKQMRVLGTPSSIIFSG